MAEELTDAGENLALDFLCGRTPTDPTTPLKIALLTAQGTDSAAGTEFTGGSYARQDITFGTAAASGAISNTNAISFTDMPAGTLVGFAIYNNGGTVRLWEIPRTGGSISVSAGATVTIAIGDIDLSMA